MLPTLLVLPAQVFEPGDTLPPGQVPASLALRAPAPTADSAIHTSPVRAGLLQRSYLHGEAWASESLPLNVAVKLGIPHIYLVLGVAAGPFDHQSGAAWGVGVGTAGRPRGRFTPSLDLLLWLLSNDNDKKAPASQLTQLRPMVAWQLKQGSRWQLVGGPTLNLATAHREPGPPHWELGQDQWRWLDADFPQSLLRLWPGVQLGVRF
ncbi:hypothetical protein A8B98_14155 [Hymenobacter sp. UV11]|nr:hypothetical protein A8B98_14155 [Hymenobacter sp. UV11]